MTPREDLQGPVAEQRAAPELSIAEVDRQALELIEYRGECQTPKEEAALDVLIKGYVETDLEKITPVAALMKHCQDKAQEGRADEERIQKQRGRWMKGYEALKGMVLSVMQERKLPALQNAQVRFRLQDNPVQVEVTDMKLVPLEYIRATVTLPWDEWQRMRLACDNYIALMLTNTKETIPPIVIEQVAPSVNANTLKGALLQKVKCPDCTNGRAKKGKETILCPSCQGAQLVPATVPGARLTSSQHLRVE